MNRNIFICNNWNDFLSITLHCISSWGSSPVKNSIIIITRRTTLTWVEVPDRVRFIRQIALFNHFMRIIIIGYLKLNRCRQNVCIRWEYLLIELIMLNNNTCNYLTECKQMSTCLFKSNVTYKLFVYKIHIYIYIYIYIYVCVCVCVYIYIYIYIQISLNIIDIFCLDIFLLIRSYCRIAFIVFSGIDWCIFHNCIYSKYFLPDFEPSSGEDLLQKWCNFCFCITTTNTSTNNCC